MKKIFITIIVFTSALSAFSQTNEEAAVKELSAKIFRWEIVGLTDSLRSVFHDKLQVWGTSGGAVNKPEYLKRLSSPNFIHNKVTIEKSAALIADNTAIINGDGVFDLTISGNKTTLHLFYTEVFTRENASKPWMLLTINAKPKTD
jgi:hypothetical protein